jgi:hypothetical protein
MMEDMYLVHVTLRPRDAGHSPPPDYRGLIWSLVAPDDHVEHVVVHDDLLPELVIGLYVMADRLDVAEARAGRVCHRAITALPQLQGWSISRVEAPLIVPPHEWLHLPP